jgi:hypothetical protein
MLARMAGLAGSRGRNRRRPNSAGPARADAGDPARPRRARIEIVVWAALFAAAVAALLWNQHAQFFYAWTDEQMHFYVAHRMAEGAVLYRDIESARPPLVLLPLAWLIRIGCSPLFAGRALVVVTQLATAGLLFWGARRLASVRAGALAALLFLTSPEVYSRAHYTGIHLVAFTACACVLLFLRGRPLLSGLFLGLTVATDQHGLVVGGVVALLTVARRPRDGVRFVAGAVLVSLIVFGGVWLMGGRHLWGSLVAVHLHHLRVGQGVGAQFWAMFRPWLYEHLYLFAGAGLAVVLSRRRLAAAAWPDVRVLLLAVGAHVAVVLALAEAVFLYIVVIAPLLVLLAALGFDAAVAWWRERRQAAKVQAERATRRMMVGALAVVALTAGGWAAAASHREGLDGRRYSFWPQVLHGQVARTLQLDQMLQGIGEWLLPGIGKNGTIFGDATIVSALALRSGLRVSAELADVNPGWLDAGTMRPEDVVSRIEADGVAAVISPPFGLVQNPTFKSYLFACYQKPRPFFPPESGPGERLPPFLLVFTHLARPGADRCHGVTPTP